MELNRLKVRQEKMELEELEENQLTYFWRHALLHHQLYFHVYTSVYIFTSFLVEWLSFLTSLSSYTSHDFQ